MDSPLGNTIETEAGSFESNSNSDSDSEEDVEVDSDSDPDMEPVEAVAENALIPATTTPSPSTMTSLPPKPKPQKRSRKSSSAASSLGSRERSMVWEHYEKFERPVYEYKDGKKVWLRNEMRAKCKYCSKDLACNTYDNGTSSLKRHVENVCKKYPGRADLEQHQKVFVAGGKLSEPTLAMTTFDEDSILKACVEMIVIDEMPFNSTEKPGFKRFCRVACPRFKVPGRGLVVKTFWEMYAEQKRKLRQELASHCVNITTDTWTSVQNINYMVVTAHFIDCGWNLHKRILNFCVIPNHQGNTIGKILEACLLDWDIERVLTISVDNASANKVAIEFIREKMMAWDKPPILGGMWMHVRCFPHILNLIVKSGLRMMDKSVASIRNAVRYVRSSPARLDMFRQCVEILKLDSKKVCILDVPTRWNSTFLMLDTALQLRKAFDRMAEEEDSKYRSYFDEEDEFTDDEASIAETNAQNKRNVKEKRVGPPNASDWERSTVFVNFLQQFYDVTLRASATNTPTAQRAFHDIVIIQQEIEDLFDQRHLEAGSQTQKVLLEMAHKMKTKFQKYFGSIDDINQLLLVALVLDPRYKLRYFQHICESELHYDSARVKQKSDELRDLILKLTDLYATSMGTKKGKSSDNDATKSSTTSKSSSCGSKNYSRLSGKRATMQANWLRALEDSSQAVVSHEVDRYLLDPIEDPPEDEEWKLLEWWKLNGSKYPNLQLVAKDVLAIQVSTVASESCFSTSKRVIDPFRSSLSPRTVEALICFQNWLRAESIQNLEYLPTIEDIMFYEQAERDALKDTADSQHGKTNQKQVKKGKKLKGADQATKKMKSAAGSVGSSKKPKK